MVFTESLPFQSLVSQCHVLTLTCPQMLIQHLLGAWVEYLLGLYCQCSPLPNWAFLLKGDQRERGERSLLLDQCAAIMLSFSKHLLSTCYMPCCVLSPGAQEQMRQSWPLSSWNSWSRKGKTHITKVILDSGVTWWRRRREFTESKHLRELSSLRLPRGCGF